MPANTTVKYIANSFTNAPTLSGTGGLIAVLDAVLVNGFNTQTVDSVVVSGGIATVTRAAGSLPTVVGSVNARVGVVVSISGATPSELNGEKRVLTTGWVAGTQFQFDATGVADQTATGTITVKVAPLGWTKSYTAASKAMYTRTAAGASTCVLRVEDDLNSKLAWMAIYEVFNSSLLATNGGYTAGTGAWTPRSSTVDSTARGWTIIGDGLGFALITNYSGTTGLNSHHYFGDIAPTKPNDPWDFYMVGWDGDYTASTKNFTTTSLTGAMYADMSYSIAYNTDSSCGGSFILKSYTGYANPVLARRSWVQPTVVRTSATHSGYISGGISDGNAPGPAQTMAPNPANNGLYLASITVSEHITNVIRGTVPGVFAVPMWVPSSLFTDSLTFTGNDGKTYVHRYVNSGYTVNGQTYYGALVYDVTGPWVR